MDMEIDIRSKTNNPLLNRTEVHFIVHHEGEGTPKRELVRSELAEKLNVKKENIMVNYMKASFGTTDTLGYAKIYKSVEEAKAREKKFILKRNNVLVEEKKPAVEEKKPTKEEGPSEQPKEKPEEGAEKPAEETTVKPVEEKEESTEKTEEEKTDEKKSEESVEKTEGEEEPTEKEE